MAAIAERAAPAAIVFSAAAVAVSGSLPAAAALLIAFAGGPLCWFAFASRGGWIPWFLAAAIVLPPLPLEIGNSGPHPSLAFAAIGLIASLAQLGRWRFRATPVGSALLVLAAVMTASVPLALIYSGWTVAAGSAARVGLFSIALLVFFSASVGPYQLARLAVVRTTRLLFALAVAGAAFGCLDFVFQFPAPAGYGPQFLWLESGVFRRAQGLFYEASTLGNFCAFFLVMIATALAEPAARRILPKKILLPAAAIFAAALLASFSRASLLGLAAGLAALAIIDGRWKPILRIAALSAAVAAVVATVSFVVAPEFASGYGARFGFSVDNALASPDRVLSGRLETWRTLGALIADHPIETAFGIGYKTLPYTDYFGKPVVADNMYLSMLLETGVAGLAALLLLNAAILRSAWRARHDPQWSFYARWIFCFWAGETVQMFSGDILTYWRVIPIYFWVLAHALRGLPNETADPRPVR